MAAQPIQIHRKVELADSAIQPTQSPLLAPLLVDRAEAARLLSTSERTVRRWTHDGKLKSIRLGGSVRYAVADLQEFVDNLPRTATPLEEKERARGKEYRERNRDSIRRKDRIYRQLKRQQKHLESMAADILRIQELAERKDKSE